MMQVDSSVFPLHKKMLKFLTQKLRAQSLNEVQPHEPQVRHMEFINIIIILSLS